MGVAGIQIGHEGERSAHGVTGLDAHGFVPVERSKERMRRQGVCRASRKGLEVPEGIGDGVFESDQDGTLRPRWSRGIGFLNGDRFRLEVQVFHLGVLSEVLVDVDTDILVLLSSLGTRIRPGRSFSFNGFPIQLRHLLVLLGWNILVILDSIPAQLSQRVRSALDLVVLIDGETGRSLGKERCGGSEKGEKEMLVGEDVSILVLNTGA
jgi:hypothetical protein